MPAIWYTWAGIANTVTNNPWPVWITSVATTATSVQYVQAQVPTQQMRAAAAEREREQRAATERAEALLLAHLTDEQREEYQRLKSFRLIVGAKTYRIRRGRSGNVDLIGADGERDASYCIHPQELVPDEDTMLAQKLLLETDERAFLRIANETRHRRAA